MKLGIRATSMAAMMVAIALAGCADDGGAGGSDAVDGAIDQDEFKLQAGRGAIAGLLVDDRFRPIHLTDTPVTEFDTTGFILLQETGQQVQTSENGEFSFVDLKPAQYTIRVTAGGHEAIPYKVTVEAGIFAEASVLARRTVSTGSLILTEEYSGFTPCAAALLVTLVTFNCADASAESYRTGPDGLNYTGLNDLTYMVIEMRVQEPTPYVFEMRNAGDNLDEGPNYCVARTGGTDYAKCILKPGEIYNPDLNPTAWDYKNQAILITAFYEGEDGLPVAAGAQLWTRVQFLVSLFIGPPEVDVETYQLLGPAPA